MVNILGIKLSTLNQTELLSRLDSFLNGPGQHFLVTPNPEIILRAGSDEEYFYILNAADLAVADGFGLVLAGLLSGQKIPRITGSDLTPILLKKAEDGQIRTLIINWSGGLSKAKDIQATLKNNFPKLILEVLDTEKKNHLQAEENLKINQFKPQLVFVALGAPNQEKLIWHELKNWPSVKLALAVGGSFDFLTGKTTRAPKIMRQLGIEWLWRLTLQPQRINRIWQATVVFGLKVLKSRFIEPMLYRKNVAIMLYKKTDNGFKILVVARTDNSKHWQIPQGGTDGEAIKVAGAREAREELGTDKFVIKESFKNIYTYNFKKLGKERTHKKHGYRGQRQSLIIAEFIGEDSDIKINYWDHVAWQWISPDRIMETVHPYRQEAMKTFLPYFLKTIK
ncbi:MAG: WecB/TagA/CpsF family glycosyltransferase [Candidatus Falkowbacteria bacterium]